MVYILYQMTLFIRELDFFEGSVRTIKHLSLPSLKEWLDNFVDGAGFVARKLSWLFSVSFIPLLLDQATMRPQAWTGKATDD